MRYDPRKIEQKWQKKWLAEKTYEPDLPARSRRGEIGKRAKKPFSSAKSAHPGGGASAGKPFYNLMMFPYPSAEGLHIGGVRTFTGVDIYGRFKRMQGFDVFEPIGLDGFGIHSENYAIKIGKHPMDLSKVTEKNFYRQLLATGNGFAWDERLETYDPEYYKWTQWIFVQLFKHGLAYRKKQAVNWCPSCQTVLADEQVIGGVCERCGTVVEKRELEQWFFRITKYAERLDKNLDKIKWDERVKTAQRNWIGRSEGSLIKFPLALIDADNNADKRGKNISENLRGNQRKSAFIEVFTTRPDTLFGATYVVLAPEHELLKNNELRISNYEKVKEYVHATKNKSEADRIAEGRDPPSHEAMEGQGKTGVELKGIKAINPANNEEIPVWVADYVLGNVGTGAIMAVPAHDERDFEFAKKFHVPIHQVIEPLFIQSIEPGKVVEGVPFDHRDSIIAIVKHWSEEKYIGLKWKKVAWGTFITGGIEKGQTAEEAAVMEIREETGFLRPKLIADFGIVHGKFYHVPKKVNRFAHAHVLYFELQDSTREDITTVEQENHEVFWLTKQELKKFLTPDSHQWALEMLNGNRAYTGGGLLTNSGKFIGMDSEQAKWEITKFVSGKRVTKYRLRDWLISRQRYWGPPIPLIFCESCAGKGRGYHKEMPGWYPVSEKDLPVKLPYIKNFRPTGSGHSPLANVPKFYKIRCPKCKSWARRETDVSDTFLDSAWYYLRYASVHEKNKPWNPQITKKWLPVDMYIGGAEHSVLHLLYVRFLAMVFKDLKLIHFEEPFKEFRAHGLVTKDGAKMSKSKGNVVNPDEYMRAYGIDAVRMYLAFLVPLTEGGDFRAAGIKGVTRFLERTWKFVLNHHSNLRNKENIKPAKDNPVERLLHKTIKKVGEDVETLQYNTAISALMVLLNGFEDRPELVTREDIKIFLKLLAPFAPFIAEELYTRINADNNADKRGKNISENLRGNQRKSAFRSIHKESWPKFNPKMLQEETFELIVQVNGKLRGRVSLPRGTSEADAKKAALAVENVKEFISGEPKKVIYIPNRLINFVV